ncbi:MAG: site-specific integrase [Gammaproteobacteria bacterium]|nr:site-specific integrase [Gammaproteobacteria bacterium]
MAAALAQIDATNCAPSTKRAIRFTALTAARQIEVRRATWEQFDIEAAVWVKPSEPMKTGKAHRVPLSVQALDVLGEARADARGGGLAFPGSRPGAMLGDKVMTQALRKAGVAASGHGFRSSFKDWARHHDVDELLSELALAHVEGSATVAAYARDDLLDKRRPVMQLWADTCMEHVPCAAS